MVTKAMVPTGKATEKESCRNLGKGEISQFQNRLERLAKVEGLNSKDQQNMKNEHDHNSQETLNILA